MYNIIVRLGLTALFVDVWTRFIFKEELISITFFLLFSPLASSLFAPCLCLSLVSLLNQTSYLLTLRVKVPAVSPLFSDWVFFRWLSTGFSLFFQQRTTSFCSWTGRDVITCPLYRTVYFPTASENSHLAIVRILIILSTVHCHPPAPFYSHYRFPHFICCLSSSQSVFILLRPSDRSPYCW